MTPIVYHMINLIHLRIKIVLISLILFITSCKNISNFENTLIEGNVAWNVFVRYKNDSIAKYKYLVVFKKDKSWDAYMRANPDSKRIVRSMYIDGVKDISKWNFNKQDSTFVLGEDKQYKFQKINGDTIFLESLFDKNVRVIYVKDRKIKIPDY